MEKRALGWRDTKNLATRADLCATCHVGTDRADVNHDLIAAGHPRLSFELGSFVATMPPHWDVAREKRQRPDLEAKLWAVGVSLKPAAFEANLASWPRVTRL